MNAASNLVAKFTDYIVDPAILIVFAAGFFFFVYGLVEFMWNLNEGAQSDGKQHMVWGMVGMFIMVSVYGIVALISNTFGLGIDPANGTYNVDTSRASSIPANVNFNVQ
ncbi:MAG: seg [Candidatus Kaiserbacteria bacterium]|nr:seg [Candidatus Kaiserbacteria bacterium]